MKKILLSTSTLYAVALAAPAFAQTTNEPVKLGIGGYWNSAYGGMVSQSGASKNGRRTDDIDTDAILNFKGSTKLDNGIVVGASVQVRATDQQPTTNVDPALNGTATPDTIKRSYAYIRTDYGEIRIGDDDDARRQKAMTAPVAGPLFGANTPDLIFANGSLGLTNTTMKKLEQEKRVSRLAYFTPTIAGFSFAVSYAPGGEKGGTGNANAPSLTQTNNPAGTQGFINNAVSAAGSYSGKFGDFGLDAYAGGSFGHRVQPGPPFGNGGANVSGRNNPTALGGGGVVTWGPIAFGGAYEYLYDRDAPQAFVGGIGGHQKRHTWDVGPRYTIGPFSASADWTRAILQNVNGNSSAYNDVVSVVGDYVLGPGIDVGAAVDWTHYRPSASGAAAINGTSYTGVALMAGLGIAF
jgi:outer membrane protein OmpU